MSGKVNLKGVAASPGKAQGLVKVVHGVQDAAGFSEGDVLVAPMTEPSMVLIMVAVVTEPSMVLMMNKASAIVTDLGGITSHAAIVSRELGVPCVVATKSATTDLKDGMEVVVDGTEGTVTTV